MESVKFKDAQQMHVVFKNCFDVRVSNLQIRAPENSPNTDGIHVTGTQNIFISKSDIGTGEVKNIHKKYFFYIKTSFLIQ